jgi:hypothetical protein
MAHRPTMTHRLSNEMACERHLHSVDGRRVGAFPTRKASAEPSTMCVHNRANGIDDWTNRNGASGEARDCRGNLHCSREKAADGYGPGLDLRNLLRSKNGSTTRK